MNILRVIYGFFVQRYRAANKPQRHAYVTTFPALDAFRKYVNGQITLDEFRKVNCTIITKRIK